MASRDVLGEEDQLWSFRTLFQFASVLSAMLSFGALHWGENTSSFSQISIRFFFPCHDVNQSINLFVDRFLLSPAEVKGKLREEICSHFAFSVNWFLLSVWYFFCFLIHSHVFSKKSTVHLFWKSVLVLTQKRLTNCNLHNLETVVWFFFQGEGVAFNGVNSVKNQKLSFSWNCLYSTGLIIQKSFLL